MVAFKTPTVLPTARAAGQVSSAGSQAIGGLASAVRGAAQNFSEYWEKKAAIEGDLLLAEIQEEWTRSYKERSKGAGAGFAKSTLAEYDRFVSEKMNAYQTRMEEAGAKNVPARNREQLDATLQKYRMRLETQAMAREAAARAAASARARNEAMRLRQNAILSDPELAVDYIENSTGRDREAYIKTYLNSKLVNDDPQAVADAMAAGTYDADLTPSQKLSFMKAADSGIASLERERRAALAVERTAFESDRAEALAFAEVNGFVPPDMQVEREDFTAMYPDDPEQAAMAHQSYEEGMMFSEAMYGVSLARPDEIQMEIERLAEKVAEPGNTPQDAQRQNAYIQAIEARATGIREDAAGYITGREETVRNLYGMVQDEFALAAQGEPADPAAITSSYVAALTSTYDDMGVPEQFRTVVPKSMAQNDVSRLNAAGTDVAAQMFDVMVDQWGAVAPLYIQQLQKEGLAPEYVTAMRVADDPGLSQEVLDLVGVERKDLVEGLITQDVTALGISLSEELTEYRQAFETVGGTQAIQTMNAQIDVAEKLALKYMRGGESPEGAVERATSRLFPESPVVNNNMSFILPAGVTERSATKFLEDAMDEDTLRAAGIQAFDDYRFPGFADLDVTIASAASTGLWVNNSRGDGVQLMISVDGYYLSLMKEGGAPYEVKFVDIVPAPPPEVYDPEQPRRPAGMRFSFPGVNQ